MVIPKGLSWGWGRGLRRCLQQQMRHRRRQWRRRRGRWVELPASCRRHRRPHRRHRPQLRREHRNHHLRNDRRRHHENQSWCRRCGSPVAEPVACGRRRRRRSYSSNRCRSCGRSSRRQSDLMRSSWETTSEGAQTDKKGKVKPTTRRWIHPTPSKGQCSRRCCCQLPTANVVKRIERRSAFGLDTVVRHALFHRYC